LRTLVGRAPLQVPLISVLIAIALAAWIGRVARGLARTVRGSLTIIRCLSAQHVRSQRGKQKYILELQDPRGATNLHL
jgi:hypothetical protein